MSNFKTTVWSARLLANLQKNLVFGNLVNTDYQGEIRGQGSSVKINSIDSITIGDYDGTDITSEEVTGAVQELLIDQARYFNFTVDNVTEAQSNVDIMEGAMREAAYGMANSIDKHIADLYVDSQNVLGDVTPIEITKDNAYDKVVDLGVALDNEDVPAGDRFVVVTPEVHGLLLKDARFTKDSEVVASGYIGEVNGMRVYKSNNIPADKVIAGHRSAIAFAQQVDKVRDYEPEKSFKDGVKGLSVFGAKVIRPKALAVMNVTIA